MNEIQMDLLNRLIEVSNHIKENSSQLLNDKRVYSIDLFQNYTEVEALMKLLEKYGVVTIHPNMVHEVAIKQKIDKIEKELCHDRSR